MKQTVIAGVDVSKITLDVFIKPFNEGITIDNKVSGFKCLLKMLKMKGGIEGLMIVMEHTGKYSSRFERFLRDHGIDYCRVAALQIKRSMGLSRGKNDKVDAERICEYGWLRKDLLIAEQWPGEAICSLREWLSLRSKLVSDRSGYMCRLQELRTLSRQEGVSRELLKIQQDLVAVLSRKIDMIEKTIKSIIKENKALNQTCELLRSIKGIGWIVAAYMISCTENFRRFSNARKFNCYAGLAPFEHQSGTSIRRRARVSHLANKEAKKLLNLAASSAIQYDDEMKNYYHRRVAEGKRKMSCLNIIRAKLVSRMFAVVKRQTPYQPLIIAA